MIGTFVENSDDGHVALRRAVLRTKAWFPSPEGLASNAFRADELADCARHAAGKLEECGVTFLQFDRELTNSELIALAQTFGEPLEQPNPRTQPWVDNSVILNLRADQEETEDQEWGLLFAENYVMMHTELAVKSLANQPRYLLLYCVEPPPVQGGGQTLLVSMQRVFRALSRQEANILQHTWYARHAAAPAFLRIDTRRPIFNFKDTEGQAIPWCYTGDDLNVTPDDVNSTIRALLRAVYEPTEVTGCQWQCHALAIFDNTRFFHGRTFGQRPTDGSPSRHLRRVRVRCSISGQLCRPSSKRPKQEVLL